MLLPGRLAVLAASCGVPRRGSARNSLMRYVAINFETANSHRASACALGIAVVEGTAITESRFWLIRPRELIFNPYNVFIHGITAQGVEMPASIERPHAVKWRPKSA